MDYQTQYNQKLVTADEAVKVIKSRRLGRLCLDNGDSGSAGCSAGSKEQMSWKM